jgi:glycerol-3-phosphate dehydrogenase
MQPSSDVAVIGAGVVGCAVALALARRGVAVALLEAEAEPGLCASGTNSGILHTGFDSAKGELETELIVRAAILREPVLSALGVPLLRCGALMRPAGEEQRIAVAGLARNADRNGVETRLRDDGALEVPGESVTDPVAMTLALADGAVRHGAVLRTSFRAARVERSPEGLTVHERGGERIDCRATVNCAGLYADEVARSAGDDSFEVYPRKGDFLVFDQRAGDRLEQILLPVPSGRTKGVLVFPTVDGKVIAGPTAVDLEDKRDWSVSPTARQEIVLKAAAMFPPLDGREPIAQYAGLRPAGRGVNYLIAPSTACPGLINLAAIRSTGLTASLAIAERACWLVGELGVALGPEQPLIGAPPAKLPEPWWRRTADYRAREADRAVP